MRVCVIGGYVGLVIVACLAYTGDSVICVDNNAAKVEQLQAGRSPIYEPGLESIMQSAMTVGTLTLTADLATGVTHGDILFIAVGTLPLPKGNYIGHGIQPAVVAPEREVERLVAQAA